MATIHKAYVNPSGDVAPCTLKVHGQHESWPGGYDTKHWESVCKGCNPPVIPRISYYVFRGGNHDGHDQYELDHLAIEAPIIISEIKLWAYGNLKTAYNQSWLGDLYIKGAWLGEQSLPLVDSNSWQSVAFTGSWNQDDFNAAQVKIHTPVYSEDPDSEYKDERRIFAVRVEVSYTMGTPPPPDPKPEPEEPAEPSMSDLVTAKYKGYAQSKSRRPTLRVYAYYGEAGSQQLDVTAWVTNAECSFSLEHEASEGNVTILDKAGMFDPLSGGPYAAVFEEHNKIEIYMGYSNEVYKVFTGRVADGAAHYEANKTDELSVPLIDMGKTFWERRITSELYQNVSVNTILTDVFKTKGGLSDDDITLAPQTYVVNQIQFIDESLMDIGYMLMLPKRYRMYFNYGGKLVSRSSDASDTSSWDYRLEDVEMVNYEWGDPATNRIVVSGQNLALERTLGEEVTFYEMHLEDWLSKDGPRTHKYKWSKMTEGTVYEEVRNIAHPQDTHTKEWWDAIQGPFTYDWGFEFTYPKVPKNDGNKWLHGYFVGKRATYFVPRAMGIAQDDELIEKYGEISLEIDNPVIQSDESATALAEALLERAKIYRYSMKLKVVQNLSHEPGDRITFPHPRTKERIHCQVLKVTHKIDVGGEVSTELDVLKL